MGTGRTYTTEIKAIKFDEILAEYNRLVNYRHSLAGTILSNVESMIAELGVTGNDNIIVKQVNKKIDPESLRGIQAEIKRIDNVISFINSTVYGDENITFDSQLDSQTNTNEDELTRTDQ